MANPHAGHKRGLGPTLIVVVLLIAGGGAAVHYMSPVTCRYRATVAGADGQPLELEAPGEREWLERDGTLWLRVESRRDYPLWGLHVAAEEWSPSRLTRLRSENPDLGQNPDYWPDPASPHGGVGWATGG